MDLECSYHEVTKIDLPDHREAARTVTCTASNAGTFRSLAEQDIEVFKLPGTERSERANLKYNISYSPG